MQMSGMSEPAIGGTAANIFLRASSQDPSWSGTHGLKNSLTNHLSVQRFSSERPASIDARYPPNAGFRYNVRFEPQNISPIIRRSNADQFRDGADSAYTRHRHPHPSLRHQPPARCALAS